VRYQVLGPLQVTRDLQGAAAEEIELGPPKQRALLALLVLNAGQVVSTEAIIDSLWAQRAPRTAGHSVQVYVSELRRSLRGPGREEPIETRGGGYRLTARDDEVDARQFERFVASGRRELAESRPDAAVASLAAGLALWRGPVLADLATADFVQPHIQALDGLRLDAMESLAEARLATGDPDGALSVLTSTVSADPLREQPRALLMLALYRLGRQVEALRSYQQYSRLLADELGLDPSPALRRLQEQVLLHDPVLEGGAAPTAGATRNPYKGLRSFTVDDAGDFFGREALVERVLDELRLGARFLTLVGPSGSGKSSTLGAGVLPKMSSTLPNHQPVPVPLDEEGARLLEQMDSEPPGSSTLLLLDQLEDIFTQPDQGLTDRLLRGLAEQLSRRDIDVRALGTLRADFYDRPLQDSRIAETFLAGVVTVLPLAAAELRQAIVRPAHEVGVEVEPGLVAELVAEAVHRPGALPLLQYALTELFDRCRGNTMTAAAYHDIGGLSGAVQRRADRLFTGLSRAEQDVAMHLLLRLVRVRPGGCEARRRVAMAEISGMPSDPVDLSRVLQQLIAHRFLSVDRDPTSSEVTIELAHESLLREWSRFADWAEGHRSALAGRDMLLRAVDEWEAAGRHPDYLLRGRRLERFTAEGADGRLPLIARERELLDASLGAAAAELARTEAAAMEAGRRRRRERRRLAALATGTVLAVGAVAVSAVGDDSVSAPRVGLLFHDAGTEVDQEVRAGFDQAVADHDLVATVRSASPAGAARELRKLAARQLDVVIVLTIQTPVAEVARRHPETQFVVADQQIALPNVTSLVSLDEQGSYLAGAAAALTTRTGTVGFVGGVSGALIGRFEAGYTAGARAIDPDIEVLVDYLSRPPDLEGFVDVAGGERAARSMYESGADVVFAAAGQSGLGVFEAAADLSEAGRGQLWAIGVDTDQYETVAFLPGVVDPARWQRHILTSMTKSAAANIEDLLTDVAAGRLQPGPRRVGLSTGAVGLSFTGGHLDGVRSELAQLRRRIVSGAVLVPSRP
jgi:basic membrane lipoprotein Med (substrate-binding protein (PBP1-ABC) superfamily)/DNA-binding SARP family transcriptional activator